MINYHGERFEKQLM